VGVWVCGCVGVRVRALPGRTAELLSLRAATCTPCHAPLCGVVCAARAARAGSHAGEHVQVEGSFDNWTTRQALTRNGREFTVIKLLPPGVYQVCVCARAMCVRVFVALACLAR
jgi:hypothetical protein